MDRIIGRLADRLAAPSSRRGFLGTLAKLSAISAATAVGLGMGTAAAATCCTNLCANIPPGQTCPSSQTYCSTNSYCCGVQPNRWLCAACSSTDCTTVDCYNTVQVSGTMCPNGPSR